LLVTGITFRLIYEEVGSRISFTGRRSVLRIEKLRIKSKAGKRGIETIPYFYKYFAELA
jgi:hypothetical protein